jgi:hypothetical protein
VQTPCLRDFEVSAIDWVESTDQTSSTDQPCSFSPAVPTALYTVLETSPEITITNSEITITNFQITITNFQTSPTNLTDKPIKKTVYVFIK